MASNSPAVVAEKPLNQTQLKNLRELVDGDFMDMKAQLFQLVSDRVEAREQFVRDEFANGNVTLDQARDRLTKMVRDFEDQVAAFVREIRNDGITVTHNRGLVSVSTYDSYMEQEGFTSQLEDVRRRGQRLRSAITAVLDREQRRINRQILLQGISGAAAQELIDDLPSKDDLLALVDTELGEHKDVKELMS